MPIYRFIIKHSYHFSLIFYLCSQYTVLVLRSTWCYEIIIVPVASPTVNDKKQSSLSLCLSVKRSHHVRRESLEIPS
jgi:hypothetical protein